MTEEQMQKMKSEFMMATKRYHSIKAAVSDPENPIGHDLWKELSEASIEMLYLLKTMRIVLEAFSEVIVHMKGINGKIDPFFLTLWDDAEIKSGEIFHKFGFYS